MCVANQFKVCFLNINMCANTSISLVYVTCASIYIGCTQAQFSNSILCLQFY